MDVDPNRKCIDTSLFGYIVRQSFYQRLSVNRAATCAYLSEDEDVILVDGLPANELAAIGDFIEYHLGKIEWRPRNL